MNPVRKRIYEVVAKIPFGRVATYGQIASLIDPPTGPRVVGWAMANSPKALALPCHRVVNRKGTLAPSHVFGGYEAQRAMLEAEGITFTPHGLINMRAHLWVPALGPQDRG